MRSMIMFSALLLAFLPLSSFAADNGGMTTFDSVFAATMEKDGVKEITFEQFMSLKDAGGFVILDVLSSESYAKEHIPGSLNLPVDKITEESAKAIIPEGSGVIVYCGGFKCKASTRSAQKLTQMGYKVLDYKGGLQDWEDKGNKLVN